MNESICVNCRLAVHGDCSWAQDGEPVDGWTAIQSRNGYAVLTCPKFQEGRGLPREINTEGLMLLLEAAVVAMREDYIHGKDRYSEKPEYVKKRAKRMSLRERMLEAAEERKNARKSIEAWLRGDGSKLLRLEDVEDVIRKLRKMAKRYESEMARNLANI